MPQLDPTWFASQLFWLAIAFAVLYILIARVFLPPLMGIMAARKETIDGDIAASESLSAQAEEAQAIYEKALAEARVKSKQIIDDAVLAQQQAAEKATAELQASITDKLEKAEARIEQTRAKLLAELSGASGDIADAIASKLTGKTSPKAGNA